MAKHKAAVVQWTAKLLDRSYNTRRIEEWTAEAVAQGARLIVFPECSNTGYIYRSKEEALEGGDALDSEWVADVRSIAALHAIHLAVGFTEKEEATGNLYNSVLCCAPDGSVAAVYRKHFLVSFDHYFFTPGDRGFPVVDSEMGRLGFLVCGDARIPELARNNGLNEVDILIYPTAWGSRDQLEINVKARGIENGFWVLAADKVGVERGFSYPGRSFIMAPDGRIVAEAGEEAEELLIGEIDLDIPSLFRSNRHPALYGGMQAAKPAERPRQGYLHPAVLRLGERDAGRVEERLREAIMLGAQCAFVVLTDESGDLERELRRGSDRTGLPVIAGVPASRGATFYRPGEEPLRQEEIHDKAKGEAWPLLGVASAQVGLLVESDGYLPEMARCMSFDGASLLFWLHSEPMTQAKRLLAKARAIENQMYVIAAGGDASLATAIAPDGSELWSPPVREGTVLHWHLPLSRTEVGETLPLTDILKDRPYAPVKRLFEFADENIKR